MKRAWVSIALGAGLLGLAVSGPSALASVDVGQPAPPLAVDEFDGHPFDLNAMHGKVVVVNYWATWCQPCRAEMPALDAFYRRYHARGVEMIGLSADVPRERDTAQKMMAGFAYPAAMMRDARPNGFGRPAALPITYVIDTAGVVRAKFQPDETGVTEQSLAAAVLPLLPQDKWKATP